MNKPSDRQDGADRLKLIGLGERSLQKSYYPELRKRLAELERFRALLDRSSDFIFLTEAASGRIADVNEATCASLGYTREELSAKSVSDFSDFDGKSCTLSESIQGSPQESVFYAADGRIIPVELAISTTLVDGRRYCIIVARDITERKNMEAAIRLTQYAIDTSSTAIFWVQGDGSLAYVNEAACRHLGYDRRELLALRVWDFDLNLNAEVWRERGWRTVKGQGSVSFESQHRRKDGGRTPVEVQSHHVNFEGREYICAFVTDIAQRKDAERRLRESLAEKETLLKEVHHRVKNNLQIVSSLLHLQMNTATSPEAGEPLRESAARVATMALVHEQIYRSQSLSRINLDSYLRQLVTRLVETFRGPRQVNAGVVAPHLSVPLDTAIPLGLIVNEVVTNSLKHAFADRPAGSLRVKLVQRGDGLRLTIADNGAGLPPDFRSEESGSLGMQLIWSLTRQLDGRASLKSRKGAIFRLAFPADTENAAP